MMCYKCSASDHINLGLFNHMDESFPCHSLHHTVSHTFVVSGLLKTANLISHVGSKYHSRMLLFGCAHTRLDTHIHLPQINLFFIDFEYVLDWLGITLSAHAPLNISFTLFGTRISPKSVVSSIQFCS